MEKKKLTKKQEKFCKEYLANGYNAAAAARAAGYSSKTAKQIAKENLTKPYLAEAISIEGKKNEERYQCSKDALAWKIEDAICRAKEDKNYPAEIRGLELLGKLCGHFTDKHSVEGDIRIRTVWGLDDKDN